MVGLPPEAGVIVSARAKASVGAWPDVIALLGDMAAAPSSGPEAILMLSEAYLRTGQPRAAEEWLRPRLVTVDRGGDRAAGRRALNLYGAAAFEIGQIEDAERAFSRALERARADGDDLLIARAMNNLGLIANVRGAHEAALSSYLLALPVYQRLGHLRGLAETYHNMAISYRDLGQLERADECERRTIEYARELPNPRLVALAQTGRAETTLQAGDAVLALAGAQRAAEDFARLGDVAGEADARRIQGLAAAALGRYPAAYEAVQQAITLADQHGNAVIEGEARRAMAEVALAAGDRVVAQREAAHAW
jgi:tetratricopeptide (TPR) repeat protein